MTPEHILANPPKVISQAQREAYFRDGYLLLESFIDDTWLERLWQVTQTFIDQSRELSRSNSVFDLEDGHSSSAPRLRRLSHPVEQHPLYKEFAFEGPLVDLAEDLLGPDVVYHHSKLNFKWAGGGEEVKWHQDIQFWPHTNYSPLTVGVFLDDVGADMGNVGFVPGSHEGELFDQYDGDRWVGCLSDAAVRGAGVERAVFPVGPAGSVTIHNCRTIHGSAPNRSQQQRPLLLQTYSAADAFPYTGIVRGSAHGDELIRGKPARWARHDPRPCQVGPSRARTIFEVQQGEV